MVHDDCDVQGNAWSHSRRKPYTEHLEILSKIKPDLCGDRAAESPRPPSGSGLPQESRGPPSMEGAAWLLLPQGRRKRDRDRDS